MIALVVRRQVAAVTACSLLLSAPAIPAAAQTAKVPPAPAQTAKAPPAQTAKAAPAPAKTANAPPAAARDVDGGWPRAFNTPSGALLLLYQPQVVSWTDQKRAVLHLAVSYTAFRGVWADYRRAGSCYPCPAPAFPPS